MFALVDISEGGVIETCPVIELPSDDAALLADSILTSYMYFLGEKKDRAFVVLGFGSIYNHTRTPNAKFNDKTEDRVVEFVATRDIKKGEEITVNYNPDDKEGVDKLWFEKGK